MTLTRRVDYSVTLYLPNENTPSWAQSLATERKPDFTQHGALTAYTWGALEEEDARALCARIELQEAVDSQMLSLASFTTWWGE